MGGIRLVAVGALRFGNRPAIDSAVCLRVLLITSDGVEMRSRAHWLSIRKVI